MPALRTTRASTRSMASNHPLSTSRTTREQKEASRNSRKPRKLTFVPQEKVAAIVAAVRVGNGALSRNQLKSLSEFHGITQKAITDFVNSNTIADGQFMALHTIKDQQIGGPSSFSRELATYGTSLTTMKPFGDKEVGVSSARPMVVPAPSVGEALQQSDTHSQETKEPVSDNKREAKQAKRGAVKTTIGLWYKQNRCSPDHVAVGDLIREQRITQKVYDGYVRRYGDIWRSEYSLEQSIADIAREGRGGRVRIISQNAQENLKGQSIPSQPSMSGPTRTSKPRHKSTKPYQRPPKEPESLKRVKRSTSSSVGLDRSEMDTMVGRTGDVATAKRAYEVRHIVDLPIEPSKASYMNDEQAQTQEIEWKRKVEVINYKETVVLGLIANTLSANEIQYWPELKF